MIVKMKKEGVYSKVEVAEKVFSFIQICIKSAINVDQSKKSPL